MDQNVFVGKGTLSKVYRKNGDTYAMVALRSAIASRSRALLKLPNGQIAGQTIPIKELAGRAAWISGYLQPEDITIEFLDCLQMANGLAYLDHIPRADLPAWSKLMFTINRTVIIPTALVLVSDLKDGAATLRAYGEPFEPVANQVELQGIVTHQWRYPETSDGDRYVRLAVYDRYAEILPTRGKKGRLPKQQADYFTVRLPEGVEVKHRQKISVVGSFEASSQRFSLNSLLNKLNGNADELVAKLDNSAWLRRVVLSYRVNYVCAQQVD